MGGKLIVRRCCEGAKEAGMGEDIAKCRVAAKFLSFTLNSCYYYENYGGMSKIGDGVGIWNNHKMKKTIFLKTDPYGSAPIFTCTQ